MKTFKQWMETFRIDSQKIDGRNRYLQPQTALEKTKPIKPSKVKL